MRNHNVQHIKRRLSRFKILVVTCGKNLLSCRKIWIDSKDVKYKFRRDPWYSSAMWTTIYSTWPDDKAYVPFSQTPKGLACMQHWVHNISWSDTGIYNLLLASINRRSEAVDGCLSMADIEIRYQSLDNLFDTVSRERRFRFSRYNQLFPPLNPRTNTDIVIHIGPKGEIYHGHEGNHRLAIAAILGVPIKVTVGCVHRSAYPYLKRYLYHSYLYTIQDIRQLVHNFLKYKIKCLFRS